jgi:hypothetical protein
VGGSGAFASIDHAFHRIRWAGIVRWPWVAIGARLLILVSMMAFF